MLNPVSSRVRLQRLGVRKSPWVLSHLGLGLKMTMIVIAGTIALVAVFAYLGTTALQENTQRSLQQRITLAQANASHIDYALQSMQVLLTDAASHGTWSSPDEINSALEQAYLRLSFYATQSFFVNSNGQVLAAQPSLSTPIELGRANAITNALAGQPFAISSNTFISNASQTSAFAAAPVRNKSNELIGALVISIDLTSANLRAFSSTTRLGETGFVDLVDQNGAILASTQTERVGQASDYQTRLGEMIRHHQATVSTCHDCDVTASTTTTQVLAFVPLENAPWGIAVRQNEDEVFAATHELQVRVLGLIGLTILAALGFIYVLNRHLLKPVEALRQATERIAAGDLNTPIQVEVADELGTLVQSLEGIRTRLKRSNALNSELDARMQERTIEYQTALQENLHLYAELQHKEQLRGELLRRVFSAQEEERKRISRELHDETCQILTGLSYALDNAAETTTTSKTKSQLIRMHTLASTALEEIRRIILDLRPTMLDQLGLIPALRWHAESQFEKPAIRFTLTEHGTPYRLPVAVESALFRVVQEAINNIAQHSGAQRASFVFRYEPERIQVSITDDGKGFDRDAIEYAPNSQCGLGLLGMEERISAIGGEFLLSSAPGAGTIIRLSIPLQNSESAANLSDDNCGQAHPPSH